MLTFRNATENDVRLYFEWANDEEVRRQSFNTDKIEWDQHIGWFNKRLSDPDTIMLIFENEDGKPVGQIRFQREEGNHHVIGISIAKDFRGKGYAVTLLKNSSDHFLKMHSNSTIQAYIKNTNNASIKSFKKAGFVFSKHLILDGAESVLLIKKAE